MHVYGRWDRAARCTKSKSLDDDTAYDQVCLMPNDIVGWNANHLSSYYRTGAPRTCRLLQGEGSMHIIYYIITSQLSWRHNIHRKSETATLTRNPCCPGIMLLLFIRAIPINSCQGSRFAWQPFCSRRYTRVNCKDEAHWLERHEGSETKHCLLSCFSFFLFFGTASTLFSEGSLSRQISTCTGSQIFSKQTG